MTHTTTTPAKIIEQPGNLGALKASQLARLIEGYIKAHPEVLTDAQQKQKGDPHAFN